MVEVHDGQLRALRGVSADDGTGATPEHHTDRGPAPAAEEGAGERAEDRAGHGVFGQASPGGRVSERIVAAADLVEVEVYDLAVREDVSVKTVAS